MHTFITNAIWIKLGHSSRYFSFLECTHTLLRLHVYTRMIKFHWVNLCNWLFEILRFYWSIKLCMWGYVYIRIHVVRTTFRLNDDQWGPNNQKLNDFVKSTINWRHRFSEFVRDSDELVLGWDSQSLNQYDAHTRKRSVRFYLETLRTECGQASCVVFSFTYKSSYVITIQWYKVFSLYSCKVCFNRKAFYYSNKIVYCFWQRKRVVLNQGASK